MGTHSGIAVGLCGMLRSALRRRWRRWLRESTCCLISDGSSRSGMETDPAKDLGFGMGQGDFAKTGDFKFAKAEVRRLEVAHGESAA